MEDQAGDDVGDGSRDCLREEVHCYKERGEVLHSLHVQGEPERSGREGRESEPDDGHEEGEVAVAPYVQRQKWGGENGLPVEEGGDDKDTDYQEDRDVWRPPTLRCITC